jgi:predicted transcriptional regulator
MDFEIGDRVNSSMYSDNSSEDYKIVNTIKDQWGTQKYVLESLKDGKRCERSSYQITHSKSSVKHMNSVCDCGAKKIRDAGHVHWCKSQQNLEKELRYL